MKKTDIAMIIFIATISVMVSFFVTRSIMGDSASEPVSVKTIEEISSTVVDPDPNVFNSNAINPAVEVYITPKSE